MTATMDEGIPREAIAACVDRISKSAPFARSLRLGQFLRFVVESALDGRTDELKERTIGVEVYGRRIDYDPRTDPIVRSEAHRLRRRLSTYYAHEGSADPFVIEFRRGSYVPRFRTGATPARGVWGSPRVLLGRFDESASATRAGSHLDELRRAVHERLARRTDLDVVDVGSRSTAQTRTGEHLDADYRIEGIVENDEDGESLTLRLVRIADERPIWWSTQRWSSRGEAGVEKDVVDRIMDSIDPVLARTARSSPRSNARLSELYVNGRHSVIQYGNSMDPRDLETATRRLWSVLEDDPQNVDALAELAHLQLLHFYPPRGDRGLVLEAARSLLDRSLQIEPRHARSLYLLGHLEGTMMHTRSALQLTEVAAAIDPRDSEGRTMLAVRYTSMGFWESALTACDWALALDPVWEAPHRIRLYVGTRIGPLRKARLAIDALETAGMSAMEVALARFDWHIAAGDVAAARSQLESVDFPASQQDRRRLALALADALQGERRSARRGLDAYRADPPRFWDHAIRTALALGEDELALELLRHNPINRSYRWLAGEPLVWPLLGIERWHDLAEELHAMWRSDLDEVGGRLPAPPAELPRPDRLLELRRGPSGSHALREAGPPPAQ